VIGFNIDEVANKINLAMLSGDASKVSKQMVKLSQHDSHVQQQVLAKVSELTASNSKP
jgi:hypothetical protein